MDKTYNTIPELEEYIESVIFQSPEFYIDKLLQVNVSPRLFFQLVRREDRRVYEDTLVYYSIYTPVTLKCRNLSTKLGRVFWGE